jgi:copper chaperone CopZ
MDTKTYSVPGMHCGHCKAAVSRELEALDSRSVQPLPVRSVALEA